MVVEKTNTIIATTKEDKHPQQKLDDKQGFVQIQEIQQIASIGVIDTENNAAPLYKWLSALFGVVFLSTGSIIFIRKKEKNGETLSAEDITIIE